MCLPLEGTEIISQSLEAFRNYFYLGEYQIMSLLKKDSAPPLN